MHPVCGPCGHTVGGWGDGPPTLGYVFGVLVVFVGYLWVSSGEGILLVHDCGYGGIMGKLIDYMFGGCNLHTSVCEPSFLFPTSGCPQSAHCANFLSVLGGT